MAINIKATEAEIKEAKTKKEEEELKAQIEVYEGQSYESREKYQEVKQKRSTVRSKLPEDVPTDATYKEQELQAQYIQANIVSPTHEKQVKEYRAEIKKQQTASKKVQVLDKELPQLYASAVQEVESVKTGVAQAKQKVSDKYDAVIQTKTTALETEKARRETQYKTVEEKYAKQYADSLHVYQNAPNPTPHQIYSGYKAGYENKKSYDTRNKQINKQHQAELTELRLEHYTADGFAFANVGTVTRDAGQLLGDIAMGRGMNYRNISAQGRHQVELIMAKRSLLSGNITEAQYFEQTSKSNTKKQAYDKQQSEMRSAQARAQVAGYLKADSAHWASVASNPYTSNPNATTPNFTVGSGTKDDPFRTDYNKGKTAVGETTTPPKDMLAYYIQDYQKQSKTYNKANTGLENTNYSQADLQQINKQRENELANARQTQYVAELRAGNIGLADALINPQTTQSYTGVSTVNLKTFLKERGYDLSKPESIPNSVLTTPVKYDKAREVASESAKLDTTMGDLRTKEPYYAGFSVSDGKMAWNYKYPLASAETQLLRKEAKERIQSFPVIKKEYNSLYKGTTPMWNEEGAKHNLLDNPNKKERESQNMMKPNYQYVVYTGKTEESTTVDIYGNKFKAQAPVTEVFDTYEEAQAYQEFLVKSDKKFQSIFTGADYDLFNYSYNVRTGKLPEPTTLEEHVKLKLSQVQEPFTNTAKSVNNMLGGKEMKYTETAEEKLISGTIDDITSGSPFRGTGVTGAYEEIVKDPSRFAVQLPATAVMYWTGGKLISGGTQVTKKGLQLVGQQLDNTIQAGGSLAKPAIIVRGTGQAIDTGVQTVKGVPMKLVQTAYEKVDNYMTTPPSFKTVGGLPVNDYYLKQAYGITKQGVLSADKKFNYFQDSNVGFGSKVFYVITPKGKLHVRQVTEIAETASKSVFDDTGKLIIKDSVKQDYRIKWTGKDYAEISTPDKVIQITRGKTSIIPKEEGVLTNKSVLVTNKQGMVAGGYIGSGGKPFVSEIKRTPFPKLIPKEADTLKWRMFKGADIDLRTSPRQPSVPSGLVKPMEINYYTTKAGLRDRIPSILNRPRQFKTSIEEISVISNPTKRNWLLESAQSSSKIPSGTMSGKDILIPVKEQFTKKIEVRGEGLETIGLKNAKIISTTENKGVMTKDPHWDLIPKEGVSKNKWDLIPKEGVSKKPKLDNKPYPDNSKVVDGVMVESKTNKEALQRAIDSGKITYTGKRTSITAEEALKSGAGKQYGDNIFKKIATGQQGRDTQVYQTTIPKTGEKTAIPKLNVMPLGTFKTIDPYGTTKIVRDLDTQKGMPPIKSSVDKKIKAEEPIDMAGSMGDGTVAKQLLVNEESKSAIGKTFSNLDDLKAKPKKKYGSEMKSPYSSAYAGSAVITEVINDVTQVPPLDRIKDKDDIKIGGKLDTGLGIKMDIQGKIDTITDPRLIQEPIIKQQPRIKDKMKISPMLSTGLKQSTAQIQTVDMVMPLKTFSQSPRTKPKGGALFYDTPNPQTQKRKRKRGKKAGFIGNVRTDNIMGMYKRKEITYGQKKVTKLERQDMRLTAGTKNRIALPSSGLLKTKKKKKSIFGKKSKDEFAGFESKPKKKTAKRKKSKVKLL